MKTTTELLKIKEYFDSPLYNYADAKNMIDNLLVLKSLKKKKYICTNCGDKVKTELSDGLCYHCNREYEMGCM